KEGYDEIDCYSLYSIPIHKLLDTSGIIAIWVTNKIKYIKFIKEKLFRDWNVEFVGEWFWVKIASDGELVSNLDSTHRKPFEILVLGVRTGSIVMEKIKRDTPRAVFSERCMHSCKPLIHGTFE
ncbi:Methyltransferase-like protein 4, partial [Nowakowskiella sp. JEL0407]